MQTQVEDVIRKLDHLSPERLSEINDFIDFIRSRDQDIRSYREFAQASEASFAKVWDNDEDAVYDSL